MRRRRRKPRPVTPEEPAARSREEAAEDAARSRLQAAIELAVAEGAARDVTAADEQTDRQRLEGEEKASPAHAAFAVHRRFRADAWAAAREEAAEEAARGRLIELAIAEVNFKISS
ncbi:hypothetical protein DIPPA_17139 [Diplonema papillatum]|nr:hypothetical protein DIPPA_17139 [Diplonema papillatum]